MEQSVILLIAGGVVFIIGLGSAVIHFMDFGSFIVMGFGLLLFVSGLLLLSK